MKKTFDQWWEEQYRPGTTYAIALAMELFATGKIGETVKQIAREAWEESK